MSKHTASVDATQYDSRGRPVREVAVRVVRYPQGTWLEIDRGATTLSVFMTHEAWARLAATEEYR